jgi:hypothetical protein
MKIGKDGVDRIVSMRIDDLDERQVSLALRNGLAKIGQCCGCGNELLLSTSSFGKIQEGYKPTCVRCCGLELEEAADMIRSGEVKLTAEQVKEVIRFKLLEAAEDEGEC